MIKNTFNILQGWYYSFLKEINYPDPYIEAMAEPRKMECVKCPYMRVGKCTKCGCKIEMKIRAKNSKCPENKW